MELKAKTISEMWPLALLNVYQVGEEVQIDRGSFEKVEKRIQLPSLLSGTIEFPTYDMIPSVPFGVSQPTTMNYVERYFKEKIIGDIKDKNEEYTYGERILLYLDKVIEILQKAPFTNQAVIEISRPEDILLPDPPCLRVISFKITNDMKLHQFCYFRSWDIYFGLPSNLGGMAMLLDYITGFLEGVKMGTLSFVSDKAHIYTHNIQDTKVLWERGKRCYFGQ